MAWYDLNKKTETKREYLARIKYDNIIALRAKSFMDIVGTDLRPNIQYRIITEHGFNAISVIEYLTKFNKLKEIYICVYRMNQQSVNKIIEFVDDENIKCNILLSSFFRENKRYEKWSKDLIAYSINKENVNIKFAWVHAKVFLTLTEDNKYIVFEGSGNLSDNARIEQYIIENNRNVYEFHKKWINDILNYEN
jgi:hypothetical protein